MTRVYAVLAILLVALVGAGLLFVNLSQTASVAGALHRLGGGDQDYQYVRRKVLFSMGDPAPAIYAFLGRHATSRQARLQALRILAELAAQQDLSGDGQHVAALLSDTSQALRSQVLRTLTAMKSMPGMAPVIALYRSTSDTSLFRGCYRALKAASEPLNTALDAAMHLGDTARVDSCARAADAFPVDKGRLLSKLARYWSTHGDYERASQFYRRMGVPSCWWAVGEFVVAGLQEPTAIRRGPDTKPFNPSDTFDVGGGLVSRWFPLTRISGWGDVDMRALFSRQNYSVAYLYTFIHVPSARRALLFVHTDDGGCVVLNDSLVHVTAGFEGYMTNENVVDVRLREGVNTLMVKVAQGEWGWGMFVRVAGTNGEAMPDVAFSLSPLPARHTADSVVAQAARGDSRWRAATDSAGSSDELVARLLSMVVDKGESGSRRLAALNVLRALNAARRVPAGEGELLRLGSLLAAGGVSSELLESVGESLVEMGTTRALDLGLAMRALDEPRTQWLGRRLVNAYCRGRFVSTGRLDSPDRRALAARTASELASFAPTDPWVALRMAAVYELEGDAARAAEVVRPFGMPRRWALRRAACAPQRLASTACVREADPRADSVVFAGQAPGGAWRMVGSDAFGPHGMHLTLVPDPRAMQSPDVFVVRTAVESDSACAALLSVTLPAGYALFVNGALAGSATSPVAACFDYGPDYPWQRLRYDPDWYLVALRQGLNSVQIVFVNTWVTDAAFHALRLGFADCQGRPIDASSGRLALRR